MHATSYGKQAPCVSIPQRVTPSLSVLRAARTTPGTAGKGVAEMPLPAKDETYLPVVEDINGAVDSSLSPFAGNTQDADNYIVAQDDGQLLGRLQRRLRQRRPGDCLHFPATLASVISVVVILTWLALCKGSQTMRNSSGPVQRSLAEVDNAELSALLDQCVEMEEDLGILTHAPSMSGEPANNKARLAMMLHESAEAFTRSRERASKISSGEADKSAQSAFEIKETSAMKEAPMLSMPLAFSIPSEQRAELRQTYTAGIFKPPHAVHFEGHSLPNPSFVTGNYAGCSYGSLEHGPAAVFSPSSVGYTTRTDFNFNMGMREHCPEEIMSRDANERHTYGQGDVGAALDFSEPSTSRESLASLKADVPSCVSSSNVTNFREQSDAWVSSLLDKYAPIVRQDMPAIQEAPSASTGEQPRSPEGSEESTDEDDEYEQVKDPNRHPYVRLPKVFPQDVKSSFRGEAALRMTTFKSSPVAIYSNIRALYAKESLNADDVKLLMEECENLIAYASHKFATKNLKPKPFQIARRLGSLFMIFDMLVSAIEVLGERKMNTGAWWDKFTQQFETEYQVRRKARSRRETTELLHWVGRLTEALSIYKRGRRPDPAEIICLKRYILHRLGKKSQYNNSLWHFWRDDRNYS